MMPDDGRHVRPLQIGAATFGGGDGSSVEEAVRISGIADNTKGVAAEYDYLQKLLGPRGVRWNVKQQRLIARDNRYFDVLTVMLPDGAQREFFFDITEFFGKIGR